MPEPDPRRDEEYKRDINFKHEYLHSKDYNAQEKKVQEYRTAKVWMVFGWLGLPVCGFMACNAGFRKDEKDVTGWGYGALACCIVIVGSWAYRKILAFVYDLDKPEER